MSAATGTESGRWPALSSDATWYAPDRAVSSTDRVSDTRRALNSSRSIRMNATISPRAAIIVTRARSPRCRHHRTSSGPTPCPSHQWPAQRKASATVARQQVPGPAHRLHGFAAEGRVDLPPQVTDVDLDHVEVRDLVWVIPDMCEQLGLGNHGPAASHQVLKQRKLPGGQLHAGRPALHHAGRRVKGQVAGAQHGGAGHDA